MSEQLSSSILTDGFDSRLQGIKSEGMHWSQPDRVDITSWADRRELSRRIDAGEITTFDDNLECFADGLFEMRHPELIKDSDARHEFVEDIKHTWPEYGNFFILPWRKAIVRYPTKEDLQSIRTFRNREVLTWQEQKRLLGKTAAVFGMSVGSHVADQLATGGIGGSYDLGDFDEVSLSNLNRFRGGIHDVGSKKLDVVGCRISELDPYIVQTHHREGVNKQVLIELSERKPDVIFDEIDDLATKALMREFARTNHIPLIMATDVGERSLIDIERYDIDPRTKPFLGRVQVDPEEVTSPGFSEKRKTDLMIKIVGARNITPRLLRSSINIGETISGLPQLGAVASLGGALGAIAAREIMLGNTHLESGRYVVDTRKALSAGMRDDLLYSMATVRDFLKKRSK